MLQSGCMVVVSDCQGVAMKLPRCLIVLHRAETNDYFIEPINLSGFFFPD